MGGWYVKTNWVQKKVKTFPHMPKKNWFDNQHIHAEVHTSHYVVQVALKYFPRRQGVQYFIF